MSEPSLDLVPNLVRRRKSNGRCVYDKAAKRELVRRCLLPEDRSPARRSSTG